MGERVKFARMHGRLSPSMTVMATDGPWYISESLWAAGGVVVAAASLSVGAWATLRAAYPKRRLTYDLHSVTPLVPLSGPLRNSLAV